MSSSLFVTQIVQLSEPLHGHRSVCHKFRTILFTTLFLSDVINFTQIHTNMNMNSNYQFISIILMFNMWTMMDHMLNYVRRVKLLQFAYNSFWMKSHIPKISLNVPSYTWINIYITLCYSLFIHHLDHSSLQTRVDRSYMYFEWKFFFFGSLFFRFCFCFRFFCVSNSVLKNSSWINQIEFKWNVCFNIETATNVGSAFCVCSLYKGTVFYTF